MWVCIEPERVEKTTRILSAFGAGWPGSKMVLGCPPDDGDPFIVWGQKWTALEMIPRAIKQGRPFLQLDNGFWKPAGGGNDGYYRICVNGLTARFLPNAPSRGLEIQLQPWRKDGSHIVFAVPGEGFGRSIGLDMVVWSGTTLQALRVMTQRKIVVRHKKERKRERSLTSDLHGAWALVTHSSNVAVDAVLAGIPVFVAPTNPAAPVGRTDMDLENPVMPARDAWLNSLMCQQFTLDEMKNGLPFKMLKDIA